MAVAANYGSGYALEVMRELSEAGRNRKSAVKSEATNLMVQFLFICTI